MAQKENDINIEIVIEKLCCNGTETLQPYELMKQLKAYCKPLGTHNVEAYDYLGRLLLHQLEKKHAQIRYGCLLVVEYLFQRSHLFRVFACSHMNIFLRYCLQLNDGVDCNNQTEANNNTTTRSVSARRKKQKKKKEILRPVAWAKKLHNKMVECLSHWHQEYSSYSSYADLQSAYQYLIDNEVIHSSSNASPHNDTSNTAQLRPDAEYTASGSTRDAFSSSLVELLSKEFDELQQDIQLLINQIDVCFDLLIPMLTVVAENEEDSDTIQSRPMRNLSISIILNKNVKITRDSSNTDIVANLKELCLELRKLYRDKLTKFSRKLNPLQASDCINSIQERLNILRLQVSTILCKFDEIEFVSPTTDSISMCNTSHQDSGDNSDDNDDEQDGDFEEVPDREDIALLPLVENQKIKQKQDKIDSTANQSTSNFIEGMCKAPLPSGKLCPRRDRIRCPFHGEIIARDQNGLPLDDEKRQKELDAIAEQKANEWKDPKYLRLLSEQTGRDLDGRNNKNKRKKYPNLVDLKKLTNTPRKRLMRKINSKRMREKVAADLTTSDDQAHNQYSDQWAYALEG